LPLLGRGTSIELEKGAEAEDQHRQSQLRSGQLSQGRDQKTHHQAENDNQRPMAPGCLKTSSQQFRTVQIGHFIPRQLLETTKP
jgi:hypothetical protein